MVSKVFAGSAQSAAVVRTAEVLLDRALRELGTLAKTRRVKSRGRRRRKPPPPLEDADAAPTDAAAS
jgi:hypothetical protein